MSTIEDLEQELQRAWDDDERVAITSDRAARVHSTRNMRQVMSVYADALQESGDPRGACMTFDLHARTVAPDNAQRIKVMTEWLGDDLVRHRHIRTAYGLLSIAMSQEEPEFLPAILDSSLGHYVESIRLAGTEAAILRGLAAISRSERPWLGQLGVECSDNSRRSGAPVISETVAGALWRAVPSLHTMRVSGRRVFDDISHPRLLRLDVEGRESVTSLHGIGGKFSSLFELKVTLLAEDDDVESTFAGVTGLLAESHLPELRRLDLSSNELTIAERRRAGMSPFRWVTSLPIVHQLHVLQMPSLRTEADASDLQLALNRMPHLTEISARRSYVSHELTHPSAEIRVPSRWPWPPRDEMSGEELIVIRPESERWNASVSLLEAVIMLERRYDTLESESKTAWDRLWSCVELLDASGLEQTLPASQLSLAVTSCREAILDDGWTRLAALLDTCAEQTLSIRRTSKE